ncbi:MAG TPA: hypothetical protein VFL29_03460 [Candidatus Dormibacteraeota bacterium]|nr:hypothetical protein [Candidatus Dormibacteraeota bacterium]
MSQAKKQDAPRRPRPKPATVDGLTKVELELPDGRYLLSYARAKAPHGEKTGA